MGEVMLTVISTTYGHENYIRKALDSILMQRINFNMEVLIGEDCSPDGSRIILKEYEVNYPNFFKIIYRDKNIGAVNNYIDLGKRAKGKYIAFLELDDYWTDCNKLQRQFDFLEANNDVVAVAARTTVVDKTGKSINEPYPECTNCYYEWKHYINGLLPGQTASIMCRNFYNKGDALSDALLMDTCLVPGDRVNAFLYLCYGKIYCMPEVMSAYRLVRESGTSYTAMVKDYSDTDIYELYCCLYKRLLKYAYKYCEKDAILYSEKIYVLSRCREKKVKNENWLHYLLFDLDIRNKTRIRLFIIFRTLRKRFKSIIC
ncbi:Glycosyltransferase involved in cell wall bisynthesis [Ruminococcaceae bacterium P7]|nr:Glycosyltransferase involved in cell wall bisynthesis [Ruminococcaceae bacterium P7]